MPDKNPAFPSLNWDKSGEMKAHKSGLPIIGLFCGAGGLDLGFRQAGFKTMLACDIDRAACKTFAANHPEAEVRQWDLSTLHASEIVKTYRELGGQSPVGVVGGPPCQAFSQSNVHKRGDDPRALLPRHYAEIIRELRLELGIQFFVFENVFGLKQRRHKEQLESFRALFAEAGFRIFEAELNARDYNIPQERRRLFIVGINEGISPKDDFLFPAPSQGKAVTVRETICDLPTPVFFRRGLNSKEIPFHPNHWCMNPKSRRFTDGTLKPGELKGRPFRVLTWDSPSWTVAYGHREVHIHPDCTRRLSILEAMLLQSFPFDYQLFGTLSEQISLVSDAVPPRLAKAVAHEIVRHLNLVVAADSSQRERVRTRGSRRISVRAA